MTDRNRQLLTGLGKADPIIEVGPLHAPIAPKSEGWQTTVVDHAPREALVQKYAGHEGVDLARIQEVDVIWNGGALHEAFPVTAQGGYRALIASHVIEHVPDAVGFLDSAARLLDPRDGIIALAVPDKRWCFDLFKPVSTTGQMLAAHRAGLQRHSQDKLFDHSAYSASDKGRPGWGREGLNDLRFYTTLEDAMRAFESWSGEADAPYVDCHAWQFTPSSFELLILELGEVQAIDWRIEWLAPQPTTEFTVHLRRGRQQFTSQRERDTRRIHLLKAILSELREQAHWLLDGPADSSEPSGANAATNGQLERIEARLTQLADDLRPLRSALDALLPLRRSIAAIRRRKGAERH